MSVAAREEHTGFQRWYHCTFFLFEMASEWSNKDIIMYEVLFTPAVESVFSVRSLRNTETLFPCSSLCPGCKDTQEDYRCCK